MVVVAAIIHNYSLRFGRSVNLMNTFDRMGNAEEMNSLAGKIGIGPKSVSGTHGRRSCMIRSVYQKDNRVFNVVSASSFASHQIFKQFNFQHL